MADIDPEQCFRMNTDDCVSLDVAVETDSSKSQVTRQSKRARVDSMPNVPKMPETTDDIDTDTHELDELHTHIFSLVQRKQSNIEPKRGRQGSKTYAPTGSSEEAAKLKEGHADWAELASEPRVTSFRTLSSAWWDEKSRIVVLTCMRGPHFKTVGLFNKSLQSTVLQPEEALFLMDRGVLEVTHNGLPMSMQHAYHVMKPADMTFSELTAYIALRRMGYPVFRFNPTQTNTTSATNTTNVKENTSATNTANVNSNTNHLISNNATLHDDHNDHNGNNGDDLTNDNDGDRPVSFKNTRPNIGVNNNDNTGDSSNGADNNNHNNNNNNNNNNINNHNNNNNNNNENNTNDSDNKNNTNNNTTNANNTDNNNNNENNNNNNNNNSGNAVIDDHLPSAGVRVASSWGFYSRLSRLASRVTNSVHSLISPVFTWITPPSNNENEESDNNNTNSNNNNNKDKDDNHTNNDNDNNTLHLISSVTNNDNDITTTIAQAEDVTSMVVEDSSEHHEYLQQQTTNPTKETTATATSASHSLPTIVNARFTDFAEIYDRLRKTSTNSEIGSVIPPKSNRFKIALDVHQMKHAFKKSAPPLPEFRVCVCEYVDEVPTLAELQQLMLDADDCKLKFAVVDSGMVTFYAIMDLVLPIYSDWQAPDISKKGSKKRKADSETDVSENKVEKEILETPK